MSDQFFGQPDNVPAPPNAVAIQSSTNSTPIQVTTAVPHGCQTGDSVMVAQHLLNTNANGQHRVVRVSATVVQLVGTVGTAVGGATGGMQLQGWGSSYAVVADGDPPIASTWAVADEAVGDRTAFLLRAIGWDQHIFAGGVTSVDAFGMIEVQNNGLIQVDSGGVIDVKAGGDMTVEGQITLDGGALIAETGSVIGVHSGGTLTIDAGGLMHLGGTENVESGGLIDVLNGGEIDVELGGVIKAKSGGFIRVDNGGTLNNHGTIIVQNDGTVQYVSGATATGTLADDTTTTRTGKTVFSGANAMRDNRLTDLNITGSAGSDTIDAWHHDAIHTTGDPGAGHTRTWRFTTPPGNEKVIVFFNCFSILGSGELHVKDDASGNTIETFSGPAGGGGAIGTGSAIFAFDGTAWFALMPRVGGS